MSRAFVKGDDADLPEEDIPERPLSTAPNYVTLAGLAQLRQRYDALHAEHGRIKTAGVDFDKPRLHQIERDLRYYSARLDSAMVVNVGEQPQDEVHFGATVTAHDEQGKSVHFTIVGEARFTYLASDQSAVALPLASLQAMRGSDGRDRLSLVMLKLKPGLDPDSVGARISREQPRVSALSTRSAVKQAEDRLGYFRQLALVLGSISLVVGFLLVSTIVTVSVNERLGEIAVLRAIGVGAPRIAAQVMLEGLALALSGATLGLGLGLVTARWLNSILSGFPSLPDHISFFVFEPGDAFSALGLLVVTGFVAGALPAWRAARLPIAHTLRTEAIA